MERQVGFAPTALEFCRLFLWTSQALTHMEEAVGFEPTVHFCTSVFKTDSLNRSDTLPCGGSCGIRTHGADEGSAV